MGASVSKNISSSITKAIAKVSSNIIQNTKLSQDMSQVISVNDVHGDVYITGNEFYQTATVNMKTLLDALSTENAQQSILEELSQDAKSVTSGLNLGQYSDAQNIMNTLLEASVQMLNVIQQSCSAFNKQFQSIEVKRVHGNVYVQGNVFEQMYDILQDCSEKAVANNKIVQDLTAKLSQKSSASSEGLNVWFLVGIALVLIGGAVVGGTVVLKYIFPIVMVAGAILIIAYFTSGVNEMDMVGFSSFVENTPSCVPSILSQNVRFENPFAASDACKTNAQCLAFDWKGMNVERDGSYELLEEPTTTMYSKVSSGCEKAVKPDDVRLLKSPKMFQGNGVPSVGGEENGDVYLNVLSGEWYQKNRSVWQLRGLITTKNFNRMEWGNVNPQIPISHRENQNPLFQSPQENDVYVYANKRNPSYLYVYRYDVNHGWVQEQKTKGPGLIPSTPAIINTSGFKVLKRKTWMLYVGVSAVVIGLVGTVLTYVKKKED